MGDGDFDGLRLCFAPRLSLEFRGASVTSEAGSLAYSELDEVLGPTAMGSAKMADPRSGGNTRHSVLALFRQAVYGRLDEYEDTNDAERLPETQAPTGRARSREVDGLMLVLAPLCPKSAR